MKIDENNNYSVSIKYDNGLIYDVLRFKSGVRVEIPLNKDRSIKWFDDTQLIKH